MERGHANGRLIFKRADEHGRTQEPFDVACDLIDCLGAELIEECHERWPRRAEQAALAARTIHEAGGAFGEYTVACIESKAGIDLGDIVDLNGNKACLARHAAHLSNSVDQCVDIAQARYRVGRICQASVDDNAHIHAGLGIGAVQTVARAVAKHVFSGGIHYAILHEVEVPRAVYHHVELGAYVVAVLGMNAGEPHVE